MRHNTHSMQHTTIRQATRLSVVLFLFFILPLVACPSWGQVVQKERLQKSDYDSFGRLLLKSTSADGRWACYTMSYSNNTDTLFVSNTSIHKKYHFTSAVKFSFAGSNYFICQNERELILLDLESGIQQQFKDILSYQYAAPCNKVVMLSKDHELTILNPQTKDIQSFTAVSNFLLSPMERQVLISRTKDTKKTVSILDLNKNAGPKQIIVSDSADFKNFVWHQQDQAVVFYGTIHKAQSLSEQLFLYYYSLKKQRLMSLNTGQKSFPAGYTLDPVFTYPPVVSKDSKSVIFGISPQKDQSQKVEKPVVEILNTNDKWLYPKEKNMGQFEQRTLLAVWHPSKNKIIKTTSAELPYAVFTGDDNYAVLSNPKTYEPQFEDAAPRDFYIMDLHTGKMEILLKKYDPFHLYLLPSPAGKYISYFKDNNWWIYNIKTKKHTNVTGKIGIPFYGNVHAFDVDGAYGSAGWDNNDAAVILYDQYDLWSIKPDGTGAKKLTNGRLKQITFRIASDYALDLFQSNFNGFRSTNLNLNDDIILYAKGDDGKTGYFKWTKHFGEMPIVYENSQFDKMNYSKSQKSFIYQSQRFDLPPQLLHKKNNDAPTLFFQSNAHFEKFSWGKAELIPYIASEEKSKAILYYPAEYNPQKKYPMIVHIYERQSQDLHLFTAPNLNAKDGFNPSVLSAEGYFVLCPDIRHKQGNVGKNALDCTLAAVNEIKGRKLIAPERIGLMGHSFGGFEVNYIITQTSLFTAAVSGASIADLDSFFLDVNWKTGATNFFRFNQKHWRIGKTLFEAPQLYDTLSPIRNASTISTPLLLWTGKDDHHVNWHQTVEFYMALRRLQKNAVMLLYPNERHVLNSKNSQEDLNTKTLQWFDYYLKDGLQPSWMNQNNHHL